MREDVVRQQSQFVMGQVERDQIGRVGQHDRVQVIDVVVGNVQIDQRRRDGQQTIGEMFQVIVGHVQRLQDGPFENIFADDADFIPG